MISDSRLFIWFLISHGFLLVNEVSLLSNSKNIVCLVLPFIKGVFLRSKFTFESANSLKDEKDSISHHHLASGANCILPSTIPRYWYFLPPIESLLPLLTIVSISDIEIPRSSRVLFSIIDWRLISRFLLCAFKSCISFSKLDFVSRFFDWRFFILFISTWLDQDGTISDFESGFIGSLFSITGSLFNSESLTSFQFIAIIASVISWFFHLDISFIR